MATLKSWAAKLAAGDLEAHAIQSVGPVVADFAVKAMRDGMRAGVSPDGTPYRPLKRPRRGGRGGGPLIDTGLLRSSLSASVTADQLTLSASSPGAATHQFGSSAVPARPYLGLTDAAAATITAAVAAKYAELLAGAAT